MKDSEKTLVLRALSRMTGSDLAEVVAACSEPTQKELVSALIESDQARLERIRDGAIQELTSLDSVVKEK